ncbi:MAG: UdgX family uracil-DNA binding protein [Caulobacter sp.]
MRVARLSNEIDFDGWRRQARTLRAQGVAPEHVIWTVGGEGDLFGDEVTAPVVEPAFTVSREFVSLAQSVLQHRSPERLSLLYRLLWRLRDEPELLAVVTDPDVLKASHFDQAVHRAQHKMKAFVRFREVPGKAETYAAWFEPPHRVTEATAPFFARRFSGMNWSILTPDACVHWDGVQLRFSPGADRSEAPAEDALEEAWSTYFASIFNPARLNPTAMQQHMPKRYWRNLPEARLIPDLIATAQERTAAMVQSTPSTPSRRVAKLARPAREPMDDERPSITLEEVAAGVDACRRCDLWRDATQGVPGEGPGRAKLMFVGEQPGDQEDLAGHPFIGPAGKVLDRALAEAGVPRSETFVTNAVKHFKHEPRGKRRLHKTPDRGEVQACRWWLDAERRIVRPRVVVALGATAALSVFGKATPIATNRGHALQLPDQAQAVVTYHPSFLLRVPDEAAKAKAYAEFVEDLRFAWSLAA